MVSVTLGGIRKAVKMEQVLRDGEVYRELMAKLPEIAHKKKKKIKSCPVLYSLGSDWNEYQETKQNGLHCTCQESVPIGMKGTPIACYLQCHPHQ